MGICIIYLTNAILSVVKGGFFMALDYTVIGSRLKKARLNNGLTQEKLAEQIDISVAFLSRIERGNSHINLKRLNQLCSILGISEAYVLNGASTEPNKYLNKDFQELFENCPPDKLKLIYNIAKVIIDE